MLINVIRQAKRNYYQAKFENCKGDGKATWNILKDILGRDKAENLPLTMKSNAVLVSGDKQISNALNDFFCTNRSKYQR